MPQSLQSRRVAFSASTPARCPMTRGNPLDSAQRPLPSMITATWAGKRSRSSSGGQSWIDVVSLLVAGGRLKTAFQPMSSPPYAVLVAWIRHC
jgi:hypothetical protein